MKSTRLYDSGMPHPPLGLARAQAGGALATALALDGVTQRAFTADVARIDGEFQLLDHETGSTNFHRNPRLAGAVVAGALPTNSGVVTPAGLTTTVEAVGRVNGIDTVTLRIQGTASGTVYLYFLEQNTAIPALPSQAWTAGMFLRLDAAPLPPVSHRIRLQPRTIAGSVVAGSAVDSIHIPTSDLTRFFNSQTAISSDVTIERISQAYAAVLVAASNYDWTITIGWPTMEQRATPTSVILPPVGTLAASTRSAELATARLVPPCTVGWLGRIDAGQTGTAQTIIQIDDGTDNNAFRVRAAASANDMLAGRVTAGVAVDATALGDIEPGVRTAFAVSIPGDGTMRALARGQTVQSVSGGPTNVNTLRLAHDAAGVVATGATERLFTLPFAASDAQLADYIRRIPPDYLGRPIHVVLAYGQSRANNSAEGTAECFAWATRIQDLERGVMMEAPAMPGLPFERDFQTASATRFVPLRDCSSVLPGYTDASYRVIGQSLGPSVWWLLRRDRAGYGPEVRRAYQALGVGGTSVAQLSKGAAPYVGSWGTFVIYDRAMAAITRMRDLARAVHGVEIIVDAVLWLQGEQDGNLGTARATYRTAMQTLFNNLRTDIAVITGQTSPIPIIMDFTPVEGAGSNQAAEVQMGQHEHAQANADGLTYSIGPSYWHEFRSASHMSVGGVVLLAERFGRAMDALRRGTAPRYAFIGSTATDATGITVTLNLPSNPVVYDAVTVPAATNWGFTLAGTAATITGVSITGPNTVRVATSASAAGGTLEYATSGPGNSSGATGFCGGYGNLRDATRVASEFVPGINLFNFVASWKGTV